MLELGLGLKCLMHRLAIGGVKVLEFGCALLFVLCGGDRKDNTWTFVKDAETSHA